LLFQIQLVPLYNLEQFRAALLRLNINPADPRVVAEVFHMHDADGSGTLDHAEFVKYLLPQDFEPKSPGDYRKNYRGYTAKVGEHVEGGGGGGGGGAGGKEGGAGAATARDANSAAGSTIQEGGVVGTAGMAVPRPGFGAARGTQRPAMQQQSQMQGRDARMHGGTVQVDP
jgi:hypothetical protein